MATAGLVLANGTLFCAYRGIHPTDGRRDPAPHPRSGRLYCCRFSADQGASWTDEQVLDPGEAWQVGSYGMGDAVEMADGRIWVVYYTSDRAQTPWLAQCVLTPAF